MENRYGTKLFGMSHFTALQKTLDIKHKMCYNVYEKRRTTLHKRERVTTMKKSTLSTIYTALKGIDFDSEILAEIEKELNRGEAQKVKNAEAYDALHDVVIGALGDTPATVAEIWEAIKGEVPEGVTKGKVQYALTHLWQDEIVKVEGKPNGYRRA